MNGSKTTSAASENAFTKNSTRGRGNGAEWEPCPLSDLASITLEGRANPVNRPCSSDCRVFRMAAPIADCSAAIPPRLPDPSSPCLLYTSDAADDLLCVDLGGRRII